MGVQTAVVVTPALITLSLNASEIIAQAVDCSLPYHSARLSGMVAMYSTAIIGSDTNLLAHSLPRPSFIASNSPACRPELKAICGWLSMAIEVGFCLDRTSLMLCHISGVLSTQVYSVGVPLVAFARNKMVVRRLAENSLADLKDQNTVSSAYSLWLICQKGVLAKGDDELRDRRDKPTRHLRRISAGSWGPRLCVLLSRHLGGRLALGEGAVYSILAGGLKDCRHTNLHMNPAGRRLLLTPAGKGQVRRRRI